MKKFTISMLGLTLLAGCSANPYEKYYSGKTDAYTLPNYEPSKEIKIIQSFDLKSDLQNYVRQGYAQIGISSFNAQTNRISDKDIYKQAEKIGAQIVLKQSKLTNVANQYNTITTPTQWGTIGSVIPTTITREDFSAIYLAKFKSRIGINLIELTDEERQKIGQNNGQKIIVIVDNSPAYKANLLTNDIITAINGMALESPSQVANILRTLPVGIAKFEVIRNGNKITKEIHITEPTLSF
jgi:membrane-associated protease RseP (regulator of RpoE activity)